MLIKKIIRNFAQVEKNTWASTNELIFDLTSRMKQFNNRPVGPISEHFFALNTLTQTIPDTYSNFKFMLSFTTEVSKLKRNTSFVPTKAFLTNTSVNVLAEFKQATRDFIILLDALTQELIKVNLNDLKNGIYSFIDALVLLSLSFKHLTHFQVLFPNHLFNKSVFGLNLLIRKVEGFIKGLEDENSFMVKLQRAEFFVDVALKKLFEFSLRASEGYYAPFLNHFQAEIANEMKTNNTFRLLMSYNMIMQKNALKDSLGPFYQTKIEEILFKGLSVRQTNSPEKMTQYVENKLMIFDNLLMDLESENLLSEFLTFQKFLKDLTDEQLKIIPIEKIAPIFELIFHQSEVRDVFYFQELQKFATPLFDFVLSQSPENVSTDMIKNLISALMLKKNMTAVEIEKLNELREFNRKMEAICIKKKNISEKEVAYIQYQLTFLIMGQPLNLSVPQNFTLIEDVLFNICQKINFLGVISIRKFLKLINCFRFYLIYKGEKKYVDKINVLMSLFVKNLCNNSQKFSASSLTRFIKELPFLDTNDLKLIIFDKLERKPMNIGSLKEVMAFTFEMILQNKEEDESFMYKNYDNLLERISDFQMADLFAVIKEANISEINKAVHFFKKFLYQKNSFDFGVEKRKNRQARFLQVVTKIMAGLNNFGTSKRKKTNELFDSFLLRSPLFEISQVVMICFRFFKFQRNLNLQTREEFLIAIENLKYFLVFYTEGLNLKVLTKMIDEIYKFGVKTPEIDQFVLNLVSQIFQHFSNTFAVRSEHFGDEKMEQILDFYTAILESCPDPAEFKTKVETAAAEYLITYGDRYQFSFLAKWMSILGKTNSVNSKTTLSLILAAIKIHNKQILKLTNFYNYCKSVQFLNQSMLEVLLVFSNTSTFNEAQLEYQNTIELFRNNLLSEYEQFKGLLNLRTTNLNFETYSNFAFSLMNDLSENGIVFKRNVRFMSETFKFYLPESNTLIFFYYRGNELEVKNLGLLDSVLNQMGARLIIVNEEYLNEQPELTNQRWKQLMETILGKKLKN